MTIQTTLGKQGGIIRIILVCLFLQFTAQGYTQETNYEIKDHLSLKNNIKLQIGYGVIPNGVIEVKEGIYDLYTKPHSIYSVDLIYQVNLNPSWSVNTGIGFMIIKSNFFEKIPINDLIGTGISRQEDSPPIIYYKGAYPRFSLPILLQKRSKIINRSFFEFNGGFNINYNGFSKDERIIMNVADSNNQSINIFNANYKSNNNHKPWFGLLLGCGKGFFLRDLNVVTVSLSAEVNTTKFLSADYEIIIPNKPISTGRYSVKGPLLQLSHGYVFRGTHKNND